MHGRKKTSEELSQIEIDAIKKKIHTFQASLSVLTERRKHNDSTQAIETLNLTAKILLSNPDVYSVWNHRREILISHYSPEMNISNSIPDTLISENIGGHIRDSELLLSADCIRKNPKSYGAWHHRCWIIQRFQVNYSKELQLCRDFLKADQRNFHCWNYRRYVVNYAKISPKDEYDFAETKILENFSNYSAFHHRSIYIDRVDTPVLTKLQSEFKMIENAVFTEPDDQSAWWYFHFLLVWGNKHLNGTSNKSSYETLLKEQYSLIQSLLELEPNCKWVMTSIVHILEFLMDLSTDESEIEVYSNHRRELLEKLIIVDESHTRRYQYLLQKFLSTSSNK